MASAFREPATSGLGSDIRVSSFTGTLPAASGSPTVIPHCSGSLGTELSSGFSGSSGLGFSGDGLPGEGSLGLSGAGS